MPAIDEPTPILPGLSPIRGRAIEARFDAALMSSDGGLLVLREVEQRLGIARRLAACIRDPRAPARIVHGLDEIIRFRMLMIAAGTRTATTPTACASTRCSSWRWTDCPNTATYARNPPSRAPKSTVRHALLRMGRAMV